MWQLALPIAQSIYGAFQSIKSKRELDKLAKENIRYSMTPANRNLLGETQANSQHGFDDAQHAAFLNEVASNGAKAYRNSVSRAGGNMANVIGAGINMADNSAFNQYASNNANMQRANLGQYIGRVDNEQNLQNMNTNMEYQNNVLGQRAWGQAGQDGIANIMSGIQMGSMAGYDMQNEKNGNSTSGVGSTVGIGNNNNTTQYFNPNFRPQSRFRWQNPNAIGANPYNTTPYNQNYTAPYNNTFWDFYGNNGN